MHSLKWNFISSEPSELFSLPLLPSLCMDWSLGRDSACSSEQLRCSQHCTTSHRRKVFDWKLFHWCIRILIPDDPLCRRDKRDRPFEIDWITQPNIAKCSLTSTHLTSSFDIGVHSWNGWYTMTIETCLRDLVINRIVVAWNAWNFAKILLWLFFFLLNVTKLVLLENCLVSTH